MTQQESTSNGAQQMPEGIASLHRAKGSSSTMYQTRTPSSFMKPDETPPANPPVADNSAPPSSQPSNSPDNNNSNAVDWEKRYSDARRYQQELQDKIKELETIAVSKTKEALPKSEAELAAWKKDHPDLYDTIRTVYAKEAEDLVTQVNAAKNELDSIKNANKKESVFSEVLKEHQDANQIRNSQQFKEWYGNQSAGVRSLIDSFDARDISRGIHLFKADTTTTPQGNPYKSAEAAGAVDTRSSVSMPTQTKAWTPQEIAKLSPAEYAKHRDAINKYINEQRRA